MKKLYYSIWVDCILKAKSLPKNRNNWPFFTMLLMAIAMAMNIALIMAVLQGNILKRYFYDIQINLFAYDKANKFVSFFILYLLPPLLLNYLLIFWNNRYEKIISKYKYHNGKLFSYYFIISLFLPFVLLVVGYLIGMF